MDIQTKGLTTREYLLFDEIKERLEEELPLTERKVLLLIPDFTRNSCLVESILYGVCKKRYGTVDIAVCNGMHRPSTVCEIRGKLGGDLTDSIIYQNHPFQEDEWLRALKEREDYFVIGFSTPYPHNHAGMSGGGKLVLPGLSHWSDVNAYHKSAPSNARDRMHSASYNFIDWLVSASYNGMGDCFDIFIGQLGWTYDEWVNRTREYYTVELPTITPDAVILEPYVKMADFQQSMNAMLIGLKVHLVNKGGTIIIYSYTPDGAGIHYLFQQPHGKSPVYYDVLFRDQLKDNRQIHFVMPTLCEREIHQYFKTYKPMNFTYESMLKFLEIRHGKNAKVIHYKAPDISIGE